VKVRWTRRAAFDLADIAGFIADDNPQAARAVVDKIRGAARKLDRFSRRGRVVPEFGDPNLREIVVGHYRVVYRLSAATVQIVTVFEGHRLIPQKPPDLEKKQ
jgi:plasmid stabilization system protein ParE